MLILLVVMLLSNVYGVKAVPCNNLKDTEDVFCKNECLRMYQREYYKKNKERRKAQRIKRKANMTKEEKEKYIDYHRNYYAKKRRGKMTKEQKIRNKNYYKMYYEKIIEENKFFFEYADFKDGIAKSIFGEKIKCFTKLNKIMKKISYIIKKEYPKITKDLLVNIKKGILYKWFDDFIKENEDEQKMNTLKTFLFCNRFDVSRISKSNLNVDFLVLLCHLV